jgi:hypothetical protein
MDTNGRTCSCCGGRIVEESWSLHLGAPLLCNDCAETLREEMVAHAETWGRWPSGARFCDLAGWPSRDAAGRCYSEARRREYADMEATALPSEEVR